ncbi:hypothetical protein Sste5344_004778 [Sporothrix stenoceras]
MPSLSLLKRSGREASPWSMRTWNDPSDNIDESPETTRTASMPVPARNGLASPNNDNAFGSRTGGYGSCGTDLHGVSTTAVLPETSPLSPTKKERRDSKRDLFHGLISRSIRGAGLRLDDISVCIVVLINIAHVDNSHDPKRSLALFIVIPDVIAVTVSRTTPNNNGYAGTATTIAHTATPVVSSTNVFGCAGNQ